MRLVFTVGNILLLAACATTSANLPESERSRIYACPQGVVWPEMASAVNETGFTIVDRRQGDGIIKARSKGDMTDLRGYEIVLVLSDIGSGKTRLDVSAENASKQIVGYGGPASRVREYLTTLDTRMSSSPCK